MKMEVKGMHHCFLKISLKIALKIGGLQQDTSEKNDPFGLRVHAAPSCPGYNLPLFLL